jgi:hypothetical protein
MDDKIFPKLDSQHESKVYRYILISSKDGYEVTTGYSVICGGQKKIVQRILNSRVK